MSPTPAVPRCVSNVQCSDFTAALLFVQTIDGFSLAAGELAGGKAVKGLAMLNFLFSGLHRRGNRVPEGP